MKRSLALLFACLALGVVVAGCGGDDDSGDGGSADTPSADTGSADTQEAPAPKAEGGNGDVTVSMKDIKFNPATVKIKAGQTVSWTNDDSVGHDVTADDFQSGDPGAIDPGNSYDHTFKKKGTYAYVCSVHPGMKGDVKVN